MKMVLGLVGLGMAALVLGCDSTNVSEAVRPPELPNSSVIKTNASVVAATTTGGTNSAKVVKSDAEWQKQLTSDQYLVLRHKATERAFTGKFWNTKEKGTYSCAGCGLELFESDTKFDSGCGWPSFYAPAGTNVISEAIDNSLFMSRTEVLCTRCGGHLGHVFEDGPPPTGLRYCINSLSLTFKPGKAAAEKSEPKK